MSSARANRRGIVAITLSMAAFAANDAMMKVVARFYPTGEVVFVRGFMTVVILATIIALLGQLPKIIHVTKRLVVIRAVFDAFATVCFVVALVHINIAELSAIVLTSPLIMTALAVVLYQEIVGWRRWGAIVAGLIGTLFVVNPSFGSLEMWAVVGLGAALGSAVRDLVTRRIEPEIPTLVIGLAASIAVALAGFTLIVVEEWRWIAGPDLALLAVASAFHSLATYLLVLAFRGVDISVVASFRYTLLLWGGIAGYLVLGEIPSAWAFFGGALIVCSGIYTLHREAVRQRYVSAEATPQL